MAVYVAVLAINVDVTIVNVALPSIAIELGADRELNHPGFDAASNPGWFNLCHRHLPSWRIRRARLTVRVERLTTEFRRAVSVS